MNSNSKQIQSSDYYLFSVPRKTPIAKTSVSFTKLALTIENTSTLTWTDDRLRKVDGHDTVDLAFELAPESAELFEIKPTYKYLSQKLFTRILSKAAMSTEPRRYVHPQETAVCALYLKPKKFTNPGLYEVEVLPKNARTGESLHGQSIKTAVEVFIKDNVDSRVALMKNVGKVDRAIENSTYKKADLSKKQAVVMGVWRRVDLLERTFVSLEQQKGIDPVLYLWVNNRQNDEEIRGLVESRGLPIKVFFSHSNIGGYGRFYAARNIADNHKSVVFIDDDQSPSPDVLRIFVDDLAKHGNQAMIGSYAYMFEAKDDYWIRRHKPAIFKEADYIGTCGMIIPTELFKDDALFDCPQRYWFIEDLWLSYYVKFKKGMPVVKSSLPFAKLNTLDDGRDQYNLLIDLKNEFLAYLVDHAGMKLVSPKK